MKKNPTELWREVKVECNLSHEELQMAKKLGLNPKKLIVNGKSISSEKWKAPVGEWIREIYSKRSQRQ